MKICDIIKVLEDYAPLSLAEDFDNVGLLLGDASLETETVLTTLDVDINVAMEAAETGAGLIVSHHPIMFNPLKKITADTPEGRLLLYLAKHSIAVYAAHTNLDAAEGGLNDLIAGLLNLKDLSPLHEYEGGGGIGRLGTPQNPITLMELVQNAKEIFNLSHIRFTGNPDKMINRIAICSGGGGGLLDDAIQSGADVYITGDIKYSGVRDSFSQSVDIIEVNHFASECLAKRLLAEILSDSLSDKINIILSEQNTDVFNVYV